MSIICKTTILRNKVKDIHYDLLTNLIFIMGDDDTLEIFDFTNEMKIYVVSYVKNFDRYPYILKKSGELIHFECVKRNTTHTVKSLDYLVNFYTKTERSYKSCYFVLTRMKGLNIVDFDDHNNLLLTSDNKLYHLQNRQKGILLDKFTEEVRLLGGGYVTKNT